MRTRLPMLVLIGALAGAPAEAQEPAGVPVRGTVTLSGSPQAGVNVFLLETLEGGVSDSAGRFVFVTRHRGTATLVARLVGAVETRRVITVPPPADLELAMRPDAIALPPITVEAGRYAAADEADVELTALDVVRTPGTAADVYRAIQTFPGLQAVDEGAGLFVRGGDVAETKVVLNEATVLSPYRYESPTGGFFGAFDPFQLDGIYFSSGGFPVRYGDALSGVAALTTLGRPARRAGGATAGLAALSASGALPLPAGLGLRATATRSNTALLFRVNGTTSEFTRAPEGRDLAGSLTWDYRQEGRLTVYALHQWSALGVVVDRPAFSGAYDADESHALLVATWSDRFGRVTPVVSLSRAGTDRAQELGAFQLDAGLRLTEAHARAAVALNGWWDLTIGGDTERREDRLAGSIPAAAHDGRPGARRTLFQSSVAGRRTGLFAESDMQISGRLRATVGARTDRGSLTGRRTLDPRAALAFRLGGPLVLTGAWGRYHQVPAPLLYEPTIGDTTLGPMRAEHWIVGIQARQGGTQLRVEAYWKRYADLAQTTRDQLAVGGGRGASSGADVFLKWSLGQRLSGRVAYSYLHARRTDPNTGVVARSPFDISHSLTTVVERSFGAFNTAVAWRRATGKPFTPVVGAVPDTVPGLWVPSYGAPYSERLPAFSRVDVSVSWIGHLVPGATTILFAGVTNATDRVNVYDLQYSADYRTRLPARSQFKRSFYVGATIQTQ